jgi:CRP/FNR family cyclic AMP-dependent transcriptional regulator
MAKVDIFQGLSKSEINRLIDSGMIRNTGAGKLLFRKGDIGHEMFIILKGTVNIIDEFETKKKIIAELGPGEIFGEMAMFEKRARSAHAQAKEPSQILILSEEALEKLLEKKIPRRFLANIIAVLCHRLRVTNSMFMRAKYGTKLPKDVQWLD